MKVRAAWLWRLFAIQACAASMRSTVTVSAGCPSYGGQRTVCARSPPLSAAALPSRRVASGPPFQGGRNSAIVAPWQGKLLISVGRRLKRRPEQTLFSSLVLPPEAAANSLHAEVRAYKPPSIARGSLLSRTHTQAVLLQCGPTLRSSRRTPGFALRARLTSIVSPQNP
jgi:hypothetical protein